MALFSIEVLKFFERSLIWRCERVTFTYVIDLRFTELICQACHFMVVKCPKLMLSSGIRIVNLDLYVLGKMAISPQCLKILEKVSFNIASEASYLYILSWKEFIKNAKKWPILVSFWKPEAFDLTVIPDRLSLIGQKWVKMPKFWMIFKHQNDF